MQQTGFIYSQPLPSDYIAELSGNSPLKLEVLQADRDWRPYLPTFETQAFKYFDTMACVSFSALNCLEIYTKRKFDKNINWSDRYVAKMSGTTNIGNSFSNVAESIRKNGLVDESEYPTDPEWKSISDYYSDVPQSVITDGKNEAVKNPTSYEWIICDNDILWNALQYTPIQVAWFFGKPDADGTYPKYSEKANHGITLVAGEYGKWWYLYESEPGAKNNIKQVAWDSIFWGAMRHIISFDKPINETIMHNFEEGKMYQLVEGRGGAFLYSRGQLLTGSEDKVMFAWMVLHNGDTKDHIGRLLLNDIKDVPLFNMKRESITNDF